MRSKGFIVPKGSQEAAALKRDFKPVKIVKIAGDLKSATTADGYRVERSDHLYVPQYDENGHTVATRKVKCAPYDNHFIFIDPGYILGIIGRSMLMCSCGSLAVITGANVYANNASPTSKKDSDIPGEMIVCWYHQTYNKHADGSS